MQHKYPKASVITVCFNSEKTIESTIDSVLKQEYKNIEYIIIDGGSTDSTLEIIKKYSNHIEYFSSEPDHGIYDAFNKGILQSTGDVIFLLNSDDVFYSYITISKVMDKFISENIEVLYGDILYKDNVNKYSRAWHPGKFVPGSFLKGWHPPHPGFVVKRSTYIHNGLYDINISVSADFDLMLRFMEISKVKSIYLNEYLVIMRDDGMSSNLKNIIIGNYNILKSFKKNNMPINSIIYLITRALKKLYAKYGGLNPI